MIERTFDAAWFNRLCNRPEVRPGLGGEGEIDVSAKLANRANYALRTEHGGFILIACGAGFYSVHTQFAAEGRGQHAVAAMRSGLDFMFTRTDCMRIHSHCPDNNPAALKLAQAGGARPWFRSEHEPQLGPGTVVSWDLFDWMVNTPDLEREGDEFHAVAEQALEGLGFPEHLHDPIHNRAVGATVRIFRGGQYAKAVLAYNLWALAARYPIAALLSEEPPLVDVGLGMVMGLGEGGKLEVLQCPSA